MYGVLAVIFEGAVLRAVLAIKIKVAKKKLIRYWMDCALEIVKYLKMKNIKK